jgi:hypothetical protein
MLETRKISTGMIGTNFTASLIGFGNSITTRAPVFSPDKGTSKRAFDEISAALKTIKKNGKNLPPTYNGPPEMAAMPPMTSKKKVHKPKMWSRDQISFKKDSSSGASTSTNAAASQKLIIMDPNDLGIPGTNLLSPNSTTNG